MKFLILSCKTGGGHDAAAHALELQLQLMHHSAYVFDYLTLAGEKVSKCVSNAYVNLVKTIPGAFGELYKLGMFVSKHAKKSPVYQVNKKMAKYLEKYLSENTYDAILMTHLFPAETLTYMKSQGIKLPPCIAVATDYTCIPFWEETSCDYYIIPHPSLVDEFVKRGVPFEKLKPLGIPYSPKIKEDITKADARCKLNLPQDGLIALLMGGSMGAGKMVKLVKAFIKKQKSFPIMVVAICGNNKRVNKKIKRKCHNNPNFVILKQTNEVFLYLKACDIIYTKPGGLSSTEAAAARIPIVHTYPIPGCETINRKFFNELGMSVSAPKACQLVQIGLDLLTSPQAIKKMQEAQIKNVDSETTKKIVDFVVNDILS